MIDYDEGDWLLPAVLKLEGSVIPRAMLFALPISLLTLAIALIDESIGGLDLHGLLGMDAVADNAGQVWAATTAGIIFLLGFRSSEAMKRFWEGTSLLHQMRGEWFDSISCLITFSRAAKTVVPDRVETFRHTVVRLMSLCHGSALEEIKDSEADSFACIDLGGLDKHTLRYLEECKWQHGFNRVEVLLHMIQTIITQALDDGTLQIAPPILSRVYQTLSRGLVNLLNATKIKNTRFPYPYAQLITLLLSLHMLWTPFMIVSMIKVPWIAFVATFVPISCLFSLNFIAIQLEMPFGDDDNDLPLSMFQHEMNRGLLMLLHPHSDNLPGLSSHFERDIQELLRLENLERYGTELHPLHQTKKKGGSSMFLEAVEGKQRGTPSAGSFLSRVVVQAGETLRRGSAAEPDDGSDTQHVSESSKLTRKPGGSRSSLSLSSGEAAGPGPAPMTQCLSPRRKMTVRNSVELALAMASRSEGSNDDDDPPQASEGMSSLDLEGPLRVTHGSSSPSRKGSGSSASPSMLSSSASPLPSPAARPLPPPDGSPESLQLAQHGAAAVAPKLSSLAVVHECGPSGSLQTVSEDFLGI